VFRLGFGANAIVLDQWTAVLGPTAPIGLTTQGQISVGGRVRIKSAVTIPVEPRQPARNGPAPSATIASLPIPRLEATCLSGEAWALSSGYSAVEGVTDWADPVSRRTVTSCSIVNQGRFAWTMR
jgi:hypothetical protein